jgi:metal-responsive CopG/Arc/MetJ family transcriptional regulator
MATMNFSVPDDLKEAFNKAFKGENKSAVVAGLMRRAIEEKKRRAKQDRELDALIEELLRIRAEDPPATDEEIRRARVEGRP